MTSYSHMLVFSSYTFILSHFLQICIQYDNPICNYARCSPCTSRYRRDLSTLARTCGCSCERLLCARLSVCSRACPTKASRSTESRELWDSTNSSIPAPSRRVRSASRRMLLWEASSTCDGSTGNEGLGTSSGNEVHVAGSDNEVHAAGSGNEVPAAGSVSEVPAAGRAVRCLQHEASVWCLQQAASVRCLQQARSVRYLQQAASVRCLQQAAVVRYLQQAASVRCLQQAAAARSLQLEPTCRAFVVCCMRH